MNVQNANEKTLEEFLNYYSNHVEFLGDSIKEVSQVGAFGSQVLHLAAFRGRHEEITVFLAAGADINAIGDLGLTPLHYAILGNQFSTVQLLLNFGANRNIENEFCETPLQMAHLMANDEVKEILRTEEAFDIGLKDEGVIAAQRWAEFRNIQELNFPAP
jgi:ankyrin repeat protein